MVKMYRLNHNPIKPVMPFFTPKRLIALQDSLFAALIFGVSVTFMLFLLGSTSVLTSLTIIGVLLCLSLVGSVLRFVSHSRTGKTFADQQRDMDTSLMILQHRVGDHDLALMEMAGKISAVETRMDDLVQKGDDQIHQTQLFMQAVKNRVQQMMQSLQNMASMTKTAPASPAPISAADNTSPKQPVKNASFFRAVGAEANDVPKSSKNTAPVKETITVAADLPGDDDVFVSPALIRDAIAQAAAHKRMDIYVQPIVNLPQRQIRAAEIYGRVRLQPGVYIPASQYRGIAAHSGLQTQLDQIVLSDLMTLYPTLPASHIMMNMGIETITHKGTLDILVKLFKTHPDLRKRLGFFIPHRDCARITPQQQSILQELQKIGLTLGVNDIQSADVDLDRLAFMNIKLIKLDHARIAAASPMEFGSSIVHRFITRLKARNIGLIVSRIESEQNLRTLLDYPIDLAQGNLFGRPDRPVAFQPKKHVA